MPGLLSSQCSSVCQEPSSLRGLAYRLALTLPSRRSPTSTLPCCQSVCCTTCTTRSVPTISALIERMNLLTFSLLVSVGIVSHLPAGLLCPRLFMAAVLVNDGVDRGMPDWPPSCLSSVVGHMPCIAAMLLPHSLLSCAAFTFG